MPGGSRGQRAGIGHWVVVDRVGAVLRPSRHLVGAAAVTLLGAVAVTVAAQEAGPPNRMTEVALPIPLPPIPPLPPNPLFPPEPSPPSPPNRPQPAPVCTTAGRPFVPSAVSLPGLADRVAVIALRRNADGAPGVPPLNRAGKTEMAFDLGSGIRPGDHRGNALLNAHTWPDGSALGNRLLADLHPGDTVVVQGDVGQICYHVTDRIEVPANAQHSGYFDTQGPPRIAIAVCSGRRVGPGRWTKRTLWFASPTEAPRSPDRRPEPDWTVTRTHNRTDEPAATDLGGE